MWNLFKNNTEKNNENLELTKACLLATQQSNKILSDALAECITSNREVSESIRQISLIEKQSEEPEIPVDKVIQAEYVRNSLEATQQSNRLLSDLLTEYISSKQEMTVENTKTEEEKLKAAYALNLCTVSISQIIDYNDVYFLEHEYDAILNNLNLEHFPKDEALLRILKQLLDVITFFRIQEGERKMMEKEYAQRMKDAIWSAIPNPGVIVAGGSPVNIVLSLASQIGIGYMNYRKEKAKIGLEKERKEWELQRSAMEQFNGLRRELFDTAWRLADEYRFPDAYRITERQIAQYNRILMDTDDLRRYERLDSIKESFKAYPPFWYYLGNAANSVYQDCKYDNIMRLEFKNRAISHFNYYFQITDDNIMREDQLMASCALEKFDLIEDRDEKIKLLEKASTVSGNAYDVLQICAISYLGLGETDKACQLFRNLVNEGHNEVLNARMLSRLYVSQVIHGNTERRIQYDTLKSRLIDDTCIFPLPDAYLTESSQELECRFIEQQRKNIRESYAKYLNIYIHDSRYRYNQICLMPGNIAAEIAEFVKNIRDSVANWLPPENSVSVEFLRKVQESMQDYNDYHLLIQNEEIRKGKNFGQQFDAIFGNALKFFAEKIKDHIQSLDTMESISKAETLLYQFQTKLDEDSNANTPRNYAATDSSKILEEIFNSKEYIDNLVKSEWVNECLNMLNEVNASAVVSESPSKAKVEFLKRGEVGFNPCLEKNKAAYHKRYLDDDSIVAVLNDNGIGDIDIIFAKDKIFAVGRYTVHAITYYDNVYEDQDGRGIRIADYRYENKAVNVEVLLKLIKKFAIIYNAHQKNVDSIEKAVCDTILTAI